MSRASILPILAALILVVVLGAWLYWGAKPPAAAPAIGGAGDTASTTAQTPVPALDQSYSDSEFNFSFSYPSGYQVAENQDPASGGKAVLIQDQSGDGIQVLITPDPSDTDITPAEIQIDVPDMTVTNPQPINLGTGAIGTAFQSNNPSFNGDSREAWFVYEGNLYQVSTYATDDNLLRAIFATWKFN